MRCTPAGLALLLAQTAYARTEVLKTEAGSVVHWNRSEITVGLDPAAASRNLHRLEVLLAVQKATAAWNRIPVDQPRFRVIADGRRDVEIRFCRGQWQGDTIDLGRTEFTAHAEDGAVTEATVELNECDHRLTPSSASASDRFDLQSVLTHELGHVLGLGHADTPTAVMFPSGSGAAVRVPSAEDETALAIIYLYRQPSEPSSLAVAAAQNASATAPTATAPSSALEISAPERPAAAPAPTARAPQDSVSVMNVKGNGGREVTIYTCEPTLLPPIAESQPAQAHRRAKARGRRKTR